MRRAVLALAISMALVGCDDDAVADRAAQLIAEVDPNPSCDTAGVIEVLLEARSLADGDVVTGTRYSCPATDPSVLLGVAVSEPGVYAVDRVERFTTGEEDRECLGTLAVDETHIDEARELQVAGGENNC